MNTIKKGAIACVLALSQLLLNPSAIASDEDYSQTPEALFSEAELAQILAPIALYPDSLLSHIVIASTYPLELVEAYRWRDRNSKLDASKAVERAEDQGWDPSVTALVAFPSVLERLNEDLQWTQNLGNAFLEDEERVLDTIQDLREQAQQANSFDNMQNMRVTRVKKQIVIEPMHSEIVYVPYYDTRVVYGNWHWNRHPPVYWERPRLSVHFPGNISARFHWNTGINISFNYFFSAFEWHRRHIVVTNHHKTRRFRSHSRITSSHGVKRWQHQPSHRRGVAYRSNKYDKGHARNRQGNSKRRGSLSKHETQTAFIHKLKHPVQGTSWKAKNKRFSRDHEEGRGNNRLQKGLKQREHNKRPTRTTFKDKLSRNNNATRHSANNDDREVQGSKQSFRQKQEKDHEISKQSRGNQQANERLQSKPRNRQAPRQQNVSATKKSKKINRKKQEK